MNKFFIFGKYLPEGIHQISGERTEQARELVKKMGGRVCAMYALLGQFDLILIVDLPSMADAMRTALALGQLTGISFATCAALPVEELDRMAVDLASDIESARMEAGK